MCSKISYSTMQAYEMRLVSITCKLKIPFNLPIEGVLIKYYTASFLKKNGGAFNILVLSKRTVIIAPAALAQDVSCCVETFQIILQKIHDQRGVQYWLVRETAFLLTLQA